jgi:hypothetical protein
MAPALAIVPEGSALAAKLEAEGYCRDPLLDRFTGFSLAPLDEAGEPAVTPRFPGRNAIVALSGDVSGPAMPEQPAFSMSLPAVADDPGGTIYGVDWSGETGRRQDLGGDARSCEANRGRGQKAMAGSRPGGRDAKRCGLDLRPAGRVDRDRRALRS